MKMNLPTAIIIGVLIVCFTVLGAIALTQIPGPRGLQGPPGPAGKNGIDGKDGRTPTNLLCLPYSGDTGGFTCKVVSDNFSLGY